MSVSKVLFVCVFYIYSQVSYLFLFFLLLCKATLFSWLFSIWYTFPSFSRVTWLIPSHHPHLCVNITFLTRPILPPHLKLQLVSQHPSSLLYIFYSPRLLISNLMYEIIPLFVGYIVNCLLFPLEYHLQVSEIFVCSFHWNFPSPPYTVPSMCRYSWNIGWINKYKIKRY